MSLRTIGDQLNELIDECMWHPQADPSQEQHETAAKAFNALDALGIDIPDRQALINILGGDNIYGRNFFQ